MTAADFLGLSKRSAQDKAEQLNLIFRLVSIDGVDYLGLPTDVRTDRICAILFGGVVTQATIQ
jgi:hypothetical protein